MYITEVLCCTEVNNTTLQISYEVKWELLNHVWLCNPVDYTVHWILQARILEWVAFPFSRRSSQPRDQTRVSCIAGRFFTSWATREAQISYTWIKIWKWIKKENISSLLLQAHLGTKARPRRLRCRGENRSRSGENPFRLHPVTPSRV